MSLVEVVSSLPCTNISGFLKHLDSLLNRISPSNSTLMNSLDELFLNRVPARKFLSYQRKGLENVAEVRERLHYDEKGPAVEEVEQTGVGKV